MAQKRKHRCENGCGYDHVFKDNHCPTVGSLLICVNTVTQSQLIMDPEPLFSCQIAPPRTLADMKPGQESKIHAVGSETQLGQRLMALGFLPGQMLRMVKRAPFGDPLLVEIGSRVVSMRKAEARNIIVAPET